MISRDEHLRRQASAIREANDLVAKTDDVLAGDPRRGALSYAKGGVVTTVALTPTRLAGVLAWLEANP